MDTKDYYKIMGLSPDASKEEIKSAYRKHVMQYHPDRNRDDPNGLEKLKEINEAYHILGNDSRKMAYDMMQVNRIKVRGYTEKDFIHSDLASVIHLFSMRNFKASPRSYCRKRGFGKKGCGRWR
jgi:curved DNA-binding protein CbpA